MTPVSSPTPDEQAAEEAERQRKVDLALPFGRAMIQEDLQDGKSYTLLNPEAMLALIDDYTAVRAVLVVVREQLTQAQAENATLREDYARLLSRWDDEREARIRAEGPAARWCEMPRTHEPHLWTWDGETTLCPGYHPSPPTYTTEEPS